MQRKRSSPVIVVVAIIVAGLAGGAAFLFSQIDRETPEQRIGRLIREAAGRQPVHNSFFSTDRKFDDMFREQYRNLLQVNRDYVEAVQHSDTSAVAALATPESFADPASFATGLKQLHALNDLDTGQEQKVRQILGNIRQAIETSGWSASNREAFMKGYDSGVAQALGKRQQAVSAEQAWIASIDDVYACAERYHPVFTLNNGQLVIADNQVLDEFNSKIRMMNARRAEFFRAKQEFEQWQTQMFQKVGVNATDIGAPK